MSSLLYLEVDDEVLQIDRQLKLFKLCYEFRLVPKFIKIANLLNKFKYRFAFLKHSQSLEKFDSIKTQFTICIKIHIVHITINTYIICFSF